MHAFVDESIRGSTYLMCAVLVAPADLAPVRRTLTDLRLPGQYRLHFRKEHPSRRRLILSRLVRMPLRARIYTAAGARPPAREECIQTMIPDLLDQRVARLVIEPDESLVARDLVTVQQATHRVEATDLDRLSYEHVAARHEPALWAADAIAWSCTAGGDWRRRVAGVVEKRLP